MTSEGGGITLLLLVVLKNPEPTNLRFFPPALDRRKEVFPGRTVCYLEWPDMKAAEGASASFQDLV